jgi:hypothetical protein
MRESLQLRRRQVEEIGARIVTTRAQIAPDSMTAATAGGGKRDSYDGESEFGPDELALKIANDGELANLSQLDARFSIVQSLRGLRPCLALCFGRQLQACLARFARLDNITEMARERLRALQQQCDAFVPNHVGMGPMRNNLAIIGREWNACSFAMAIEGARLRDANHSVPFRLLPPSKSEALQYQRVLLRLDSTLVLRDMSTRLSALKKNFSQDMTYGSLERHADRHVTRIASIEHVIQLLRQYCACYQLYSDCKARRFVYKDQSQAIRFIVPLKIPLPSMNRFVASCLFSSCFNLFANLFSLIHLVL